MSYIRRLNRGNFIFRAMVLKFGDLIGLIEVGKNAKKFSTISNKIIPANLKKHRNLGDNTTIMHGIYKTHVIKLQFLCCPTSAHII